MVMSDWSKLVICAKCGAANPNDVKLCVRCGIDIRLTNKEFEEVRQKYIRSLSERRRKKGTRYAKPCDELTISDLKRNPVWQFDLHNEWRSGRDETWVKPVKRLPVSDLSNRVIGTEAWTVCGKPLFFVMGNIFLDDPKKTEQSLWMKALKGHSERFFLQLSRSSGAKSNAAEVFAGMLGLEVHEVFPIEYDISALAIGLESVTKGRISKERVEKVIRL